MSEVGNTTGGVTSGTGGPMIEKKDGGGPTTVAGGGGGGTGGPMIEKKDDQGPTTVAGGDSWVCNNCGERNPGSATVCAFCGREKGWEPESPWTCPKCGSVNNGGEACGTCGDERAYTEAELEKMRADARLLEQQGESLSARADQAKIAKDAKTEKQLRQESDDAYNKSNEMNKRAFNAKRR